MSRTASQPRKTPSPDAIRRAVASSTAIETGERIAEIEKKLISRAGKFSHITLAN